MSAFAWHRTNADVSDGVSPSLTVSDSHAPAITFNMHSYGQDASAASVSPTLAADHGVGLLAFGGNDTRGERAVFSALTSHGSWRYDFESETFVCGAQSAAQGGPDDNDAQAGHVVPILEIGKRTNGDGYRDGDGIGGDGDPMYTLQAGAQHGIGAAFGVRRLTPLECERLQGFDDGWTEGQADSTRYRQLGNAVAVPCAQWIGQRIVEVL